MKWNEVKVVNQRKIFVEAFLEGRLSISELCRQYDISRPTGYKWIERFKNQGFEGLYDLSRAPHTQAAALDEDLVDRIITVRCRYPKWGPKKIKAYLEESCRELNWPSLTAIGNTLYRHGLVIPRKFRKRVSASTAPLSSCKDCNDTWCVDFKGWWLTKDRGKFEPLTLTDLASRFILKATNLSRKNTEHTWGMYECAFREYGLPYNMRSDNGPPFASVGIGRLSRLAIKLIKVGVYPEWIDPGRPDQNGSHERMHGTMKGELANEPAIDLITQEMDCQRFKRYFNFERPHEALGQSTPGSIYQPSNRTWNGKFTSPQYPSGFAERTVCAGGYIKYKGQRIYLGASLYREPIGLEEIGNDTHAVYYGPITMGLINHKNEFFPPELPRRKNKGTKLNP